MDKTAIRNFAIEARKILMKSAIAEAGFYGISKDGVKAPIQKGKDFEVYETLAGTEKRIFGDDIKRRENLANAVKELGFEQVIEETAYTWFNRIIAIRFMEVNNYLPTRVRVLSSETGSSTPDIVTQADTVELNMSSTELENVQQAKQDNKYDEAFRLLFIKQCNELNTILPGLFEKTNDYMELLLKIPYTGDGVIRMLIDTIPEDNFNVDTEGQVEIIGWMYQYYNTELKDDTFAKLKKNVKITKERIPAATQLFTPDWIVRYMVENSLGRVWIEHLRAVDSSVDEKSKAEEFGWKYYLPEAEQEENVAAQLVDIRASYKSLTPQDITCIDPCMGSGHILVYMFDVLMDIYRSEGFSEREAVFDILEKNISGLDIDRRAYQLSYFALMMKARGYNRIFFRGHENLDGERVQAVPQVYAIEESNSVNRDQLKYLGSSLSEIEKNNALNQIIGLLDQFVDAKEYGSILNIDSFNWDLLKAFVIDYDFSGQMNLEMVGIEDSINKLLRLISEAELLHEKHMVVSTNPPYMSGSGMNEKMSAYVKKNYADSKSDLFAVFIEKCEDLVEEHGFCSMITQHAWMFLSSYEKLRKKIQDTLIVNMAHLGARAFDEIGGEVVQTTTFVTKKCTIKQYNGVYCRLVDASSEKDKEGMFFSERERYCASQETFTLIPENPIDYWLSDKFVGLLASKPAIGDIYDSGSGLSTADNERFLRCFWEVDINKIAEGKNDNRKWSLFQKGGEFKKWYGNLWFVVNWENDGEEIKYWVTHNPKDPKTTSWSRRIFNTHLYYLTGITWSVISTNDISFRATDSNSMISNAAGGIFGFEDENERNELMAALNSKIWIKIFSTINPTLNYSSGVIQKAPAPQIIKTNLATECVEIAKADWDSFETSIDFTKHPLIGNFSTISEAFEEWSQKAEERFTRLKCNEEEINRLYIEKYGLQSEITPEVEDEKISVHRAELRREIISLLSYAVGCMFGRYSLKKDGVVYAGGDWSELDISDIYGEFIPDSDGIIPITDEAYFDDDIVGLLKKWLCVTYDSGSLKENLKFIASALGNKGTNDEDIIRKYFANEFFKDHCNTYSVTGSGKRPIYWLFDSGKNNGFKCLVYLHRYSEDTVGIIRSDYFIRIQSVIENALKNADYIINSSTSAVDKAQATKRKDKYIKQLAEMRLYYPALSHFALQRLSLNLDDGVKANYAKFQQIESLSDTGKKQKIDLLAKI